MKTKTSAIILIALVAIALSACAASGSTTSANDPNQVLISGFAFQPATLTVKVGTTVTWVNKDTAGHDVVSVSGSELKSPLIAQNASFTHTFNTAGTFAYKCGVHPTMLGTIIVTP